MLTWILSWFSGTVLGKLLDSAVNAYKLKLDASNTVDEHALDLAKADLLAQIEARKQATILGSNKLASIVQAAFAFPIVVYVNKAILWDKVIMHGTTSTDSIEGSLGTWAGLIISFYLGGQVVSGAVNTLSARFGRKA